jgi:hypothetical protein
MFTIKRLALLFACLILALHCTAQYPPPELPCPPGFGVIPGHTTIDGNTGMRRENVCERNIDGGFWFNGPVIAQYTVAALPTAVELYMLAWVTDGGTSSDCTAGGGTTKVLCYRDAVAWKPLGGTGGGGGGFGLDPNTLPACTPTSSFNTCINAAVAALPAAGGQINATNLIGPQETMSGDVVLGTDTKPISLWFSGNIARAANKAFKLFQGSRMLGTGKCTPLTGATCTAITGTGINDTTITYGGSNPYLYYPVLENFAIINGAGTAGTAIDFSLAQGVRIENVLAIAKFPLIIGGVGTPGCSCYNRIDHSDFHASQTGIGSIAVQIQPGANSSTFTGGQYWGDTGVYYKAYGTTFYNPDVEGCAIGMEAAGNGLHTYDGYWETNATGVLIDAGIAGTSIVNPHPTATVTDNSGRSDNWYFGVGDGGAGISGLLPLRFGVQDQLLFSMSGLDGYNALYGLRGDTGGTLAVENLFQNAANRLGYNANAPFYFGFGRSYGGFNAKGSTNVSVLGTVPAPTLACTQNGTGANYTRSLVAYDWNGNSTLQGTTATIQCQFAPSVGYPLTITPNTAYNGAWKYDYLKDATNSVATATRGTVSDTGTYVAYVAPTRDATGDLTATQIISNSPFNTAFSFTAGSSGAPAVVASTHQLQSPSSIQATGLNTLLWGTENTVPGVIGIPQYASHISTLTPIVPGGNSLCLMSAASGYGTTLPSFQACPSGGGNVSASGSPAQYQTAVWVSGSTITGVASSSTAGVPLVSGGASANPSYTTAVIAGGGTGQTSKAAAFDALSPLGTEGQIPYYHTATNAALAVGSNGQCLISNGTDPLWGSCSGAATLSIDNVTGAGAAATANETAVSRAYTYNGVETASVTYPWVFQNTNSGSNTNTSGALIVNTVGASATGQVPLLINETTTAGNAMEVWTGGTITNGVLSGGSRYFYITSGGYTYAPQFIGPKFQGTANTTAVIVAGGQDTAGTTVTTGSLSLRSGNETGATGVNASGAVALNSGDVTSTNASAYAGTVTIRPGREFGITSAHDKNGKLAVIQTFFTTGTATVGSLACVTADLTVATCASAGVDNGYVGIIVGVNGTSVDVQFAGVVNALATSALFTAGHFACGDLVTNAGQVVDSASACAAGDNVGIVLHTATTTTPEIMMRSF